MEDMYIAHVKRKDDGTWAVPHSLLDHLKNTAKLAGEFSKKFGSESWGVAAGFSHDAGKGRQVWQNYIRRKSGYGHEEESNLVGKIGKIQHAIHGAKLVEELYGKAHGRVLAYCIAGHHAGLPDWSAAEGAGQSALQFRENQVADLCDVATQISEKIRKLKPGNLPWKFDNGLDLSLWIRMLYSSLVDADFLDTEFYMDDVQAGFRGDYCSIPQLLLRLNDFVKQLEETSEDTEVNKTRREIRKKCVQMASEPQGIFSLSVPTGGGKTLSSLAFGLEHAVKHNLDRLIYVIPYTSIIEQNAEVLRLALGADQVVEHHSNLDEGESTLKTRLASENWDAPVIVTTSVQFFESLFAAKSSRCRKLHNIVRSVVVFDEAQLVPVDYLNPILETIQLLVDHYNVSVVISTATQPAFGERWVDGRIFAGLKNINEIIGDSKEVENLYGSLKRVQVELPEDLHSESTWEEVAEQLQKHEQVLCVVSDRKSCLDLHSLMPTGTFHLSALMCGQHRSETIKNIKVGLENNKTVRVISTQLVEAGVDIDFPVVYRAFAGLDSIAQAAGRCNREGKLATLGRVIVFIPPQKAPLGILRKAADTARSILINSNVDPLDYSLFEKYFSELYWKANSLDSKDIKTLLKPDRAECGIFFRTAAQRFRIIDDSIQKTIIVSYGESDRLIRLLKSNGPERWLMRKLQRYTVNIYKDDFFQMLQQGTVAEVYPNIYALNSNINYSNDTGLLADKILFDPGHFII